MDSDRSLSSGLSIPQWMKSKMIDNRLDLEQGAFSPPGHDDNFFYIRYPRKSSREERLAEGSKTHINKHTEPCRPFIGGLKSTFPIKQLKSNGTDDGFKGEAAACGTSVIKVAHQMISGQHQKQHELKTEIVSFPTGFDPALRRGSKSLPASPLVSPSTSPKAHRKLTSYNKYFTGIFVDDNQNGSWIMSGLLGKRETLSKSVSTVVEETPSSSIENLTDANDFTTYEKKSVTQVFKAKPSELREMNFWSPTSM